METKMKAPKLPDHTQNAVAFTHQQAILASLSAMMALQALLFVTKNHRMDPKNSRLANFCSLQCHLSFTASLLFSIWSFILSISTETELYRGEFNPYYLNLFRMFMGEFKFEFTLLRWCSLLSAVSILRGIVLHLLLNYKLIHKERLTHALILITASMAEGLYLISYINSTLHSSDNLWYMTGSIFKVKSTSQVFSTSINFNLVSCLIWTQIIWERIDFHKQPLVLLSSFVTGVFFGLLLMNFSSNLYTPHQANHDSKEDNKKEMKIKDGKTSMQQ